MLIEQYKKNGYLLIKNGIDKEVVAKIYREARQIFGQQIKKSLGRNVDIDDRDAFENAMYEFFDKDFEAFRNTGLTAQHGIELHKLGTSDAILDIIRSVGVAQPVIAVRPAMQFNSRFLAKNGSNHWKLGAHQDWRTGQGSLDSAVVWFPMVEAGAELGALQVIPGSHTWGLMTANTTGYAGSITDNLREEDYLQTTYELGDILIFSAFLVHRSGDNATNNIRWSVQLRYNNLAESTFIERGYPMPYIYKPQEELVTPDFPKLQQIEALFAAN